MGLEVAVLSSSVLPPLPPFCHPVLPPLPLRHIKEVGGPRAHKMAQLHLPDSERGSLVSFSPFQAASSDFGDRTPPHHPPTPPRLWGWATALLFCFVFTHGKSSFHMSSFPESGVGSLVSRKRGSSKDEKPSPWQRSLLLRAVMECGGRRVKWRPLEHLGTTTAGIVFSVVPHLTFHEPVHPREGVWMGWKQR